MGGFILEMKANQKKNETDKDERAKKRKHLNFFSLVKILFFHNVCAALSRVHHHSSYHATHTRFVVHVFFATSKHTT